MVEGAYLKKAIEISEDEKLTSTLQRLLLLWDEGVNIDMIDIESTISFYLSNLTGPKENWHLELEALLKAYKPNIELCNLLRRYRRSRYVYY